jgi:hypothetical protein
MAWKQTAKYGVRGSITDQWVTDEESPAMIDIRDINSSSKEVNLSIYPSVGRMKEEVTTREKAISKAKKWMKEHPKG